MLVAVVNREQRETTMKQQESGMPGYKSFSDKCDDTVERMEESMTSMTSMTISPRLSSTSRKSGFGSSFFRGLSSLRLLELEEASFHGESQPTDRDLAAQRVHLICSQSNLPHLGRKHPVFQREEVILGKRLGRGSFNSVDEVRAVVFGLKIQQEQQQNRQGEVKKGESRLKQEEVDRTLQQQQGMRRSEQHQESRKFIAENCV